MLLENAPPDRSDSIRHLRAVANEIDVDLEYVDALAVEPNRDRDEKISTVLVSRAPGPDGAPHDDVLRAVGFAVVKARDVHFRLLCVRQAVLDFRDGGEEDYARVCRELTALSALGPDDENPRWMNRMVEPIGLNVLMIA